jgi:alkyl hydroperoxide reductase subunit AhpF
LSPLGEHERAAIREVFAELERDVPILLELGPEETPVTVLAGGREIDFGDETRLLLEQLTELSERIALTVTETEAPGRWPKTTVADRLVYYGLPWGYELTTIVGAIAEAGRTVPSLSPTSLETLASLEQDVALEVYVTPT